MTTNVPPLQFTSIGVVAPTETEILTGRQEDIDNAFGGDVNPSLSTPQGQIATSDSALVGTKNDEILFLSNQFDPDKSSGIWQDGLGKIYFLTRQPATPTVVSCTCVGLAGTIIPVGATAQDTSGNIYTSIQSATIPVGGSVTLQFANQVTGAIPCPANTLTKIYQRIIGWDTINNPAAGTIGQEVESRNNFEYRRIESVAGNSIGTLPAIYGAILKLPNIEDVYYTANETDTAITVGATSYTIPAYSIYVAVVGGVDYDIAYAIRTKKGSPCGMAGNTTIDIPDTTMGSLPYPEYPTTFNRPDDVPILFDIQIANTVGLPSNIVALIIAVVVSAFNSDDSGTKARIAARLYASEYVPFVQSTYAGVRILSLLIGTTTPTLTSVELGIDEYPTISESDITVTLI